jgi:hypothetical protein
MMQLITKNALSAMPTEAKGDLIDPEMPFCCACLLQNPILGLRAVVRHQLVDSYNSDFPCVLMYDVSAREILKLSALSCTKIPRLDESGRYFVIKLTFYGDLEDASSTQNYFVGRIPRNPSDIEKRDIRDELNSIWGELNWGEMY